MSDFESERAPYVEEWIVITNYIYNNLRYQSLPV